MGNDVLYGEAGDDYIDGGLGTDTAKYNGIFTEFLITQNGDGSVTVADTVGDHGSDTLVNVEVIEFNDQAVDLGVLFA